MSLLLTNKNASMMRRFYLLIYMAAFASLLSSCVKEELEYGCTEVEEGLPAHVVLNYKVQRRDVVTRAAQSSQYEYRVENIYVFIFDGAGQRHYNHLFTNDFNPNNGVASANGTLQLETQSLNNATIVGIANVTDGTTSTAYSVTKDDLDAIMTLSELKQFVMPLSENDRESLGRSALFMMTGYAKDGDGNTTVTIPGTEGNTPATLDCTLELERTDAKVTFNVVSEQREASWTNFSFTPKLWSIHEVPQQTLLLPAETGDADGEDCTYFDSTPLQFEELTEDETTNLTTGGSFVFYMPENRKTPKKQAENYAQRDDSNTTIEGIDSGKDGQKYVNTDFAYANDHSTYAVLTGTVSYMDGTQAVNAEVRYIIHLGNASDDNPNDYDTKRNVHYTYTVRVRGVNDIVVEVERGNEVRPGHEGDVVYSSNRIFEFDSHYDRQLITINSDLVSDEMTWSVNTPFSSGIHEPGETVELSLGDYKWIKFAINSDYNTPSDQYVKYPGDQNYAGGDNKPSGYYAHPENARLLDVQQLVEHLKADKKAGTLTGTVAITAFVDENLYITHPLTGEEHLVLWKEMVDKDDRQLHIVTEGAQYSPDGNSSLVNSLYTFKQKAIRTVFNVENGDLETAWGLEAVMETDRLLPGDVSQGTSLSNGRENTLKWLTNLNWTGVLYTENDLEHALRDNYNTAAYACLMRNRDLNGNNIIEANEVRWYLAAIDQLTDIYIGEYALDADSRLYPGASAVLALKANEPDKKQNGSGTPCWHYASSSAAGSNPWVFWSEEGASRGSYSDSYGTNRNGRYYAYRCIRNLGLPLDKPEEEPENLIECEPNGDGTYTIDLSKLNPKALRGYSDNGRELAEHDERDADNLPRVRFEVDDETRNVNGAEPRYNTSWDNWDDHFINADSWITYQDAPNACPEGYRVPNQRELLIMSTRMPPAAWHSYEGHRASSKATYMCRTGFSMNGQYHYVSDEDWWGRPIYDYNPREGFMWSAQNGVFMLQNNRGETGYVRCVRDLQ